MSLNIKLFNYHFKSHNLIQNDDDSEDKIYVVLQM